jgi:hypothetical protein
MVRSRLVVAVVSVVALAAGGTAHADTESNGAVDCWWGQSASATFTEESAGATWSVWVTYSKHTWWGGETSKDTGASTSSVSAGTYTVGYAGSPEYKYETIHVRSTGSVRSAAGGQCVDTHSDMFQSIECEQCANLPVPALAETEPGPVVVPGA